MSHRPEEPEHFDMDGLIPIHHAVIIGVVVFICGFVAGVVFTVEYVLT